MGLDKAGCPPLDYAPSPIARLVRTERTVTSRNVSRKGHIQRRGGLFRSGSQGPTTYGNAPRMPQDARSPRERLPGHFGV